MLKVFIKKYLTYNETMKRREKKKQIEQSE